MSLTEKIRELCNGKNTTFAGLERDLKLGQGTIRKWDKSSPSVDKLQKVADYFNVSVDYLLGNKKGPDDSELDCAYFRVMKSAQDKGYSPHDIELAMDFIKRARERDKN